MVVYPEFEEQVPAPSFAEKLNQWVRKYWFNAILVLFALNIVFSKNFTIQINMQNKEALEAQQPVQPVKQSLLLPTSAPVVAQEAKTSVADDKKKKIVIPAAKKREKKELTGGEAAFNKTAMAGIGMVARTAAAMVPEKQVWKAKDFNNLSFVLHPDLSEKKQVPAHIVEAKNEYCRKYVERYAKVAIAEMEKFGIPASITLAQGLLETNAGDSRLAIQSNNHFGIKCRSKCLGCTCRNYIDDDKYDMFRVFETVWESYREHSVLLSSARYKHLKKAGTKNYKKWAYGLKAAGYATDSKYAEKLVKIIEEMDLYQFDK